MMYHATISKKMSGYLSVPNNSTLDPKKKRPRIFAEICGIRAASHISVSQPLVLTVPTAASRKLGQQLETIRSPYNFLEGHLASAQASVAACLPPQFLVAMKRFKNDSESPSVMVIRNLPVDRDKGITPTRGQFIADKKTFVSEGVLLGVTQFLGEPFGYSDEKNGQIVHNVCPTEHKERLSSNEGSQLKFSSHTEIAFAKYRPDYLALICIRPDHENRGATTFCDVKAALSLVGQKTETQLRRHAYRLRAPVSFQNNDGRSLWSDERPIISGPLHAPEVLIRLPDVLCEDSAAGSALTEFSAALDHPLAINDWVLAPGELLLVNNRRAVHGRSWFMPRYDGEDRWLQRVYLRSNLWEARAENCVHDPRVLSMRS